MKVPEKINMLLWLLFHDVVPTATFRFRRGHACTCCSISSETMAHCFFFCPKFYLIWLRFGFCPPNNASSIVLLDRVRSIFSSHAFLFCAVLWWVWRDRNNDVFCPGDPWNMDKIVGLSHHNANEFELLSSSRHPSFSSHFCLDWEPPPPHFVKVNCDGSIFICGQLAGFGCIIRSPDENYLRGCSGCISTDSSLVCELLAIWHGLFLAWEACFRNVLCETYCWEAYNLLHQDSVEVCDHQDLIFRIKSIMLRHWSVRFMLIQCTANSIADFLARNDATSQLDYSERSTPSNDLLTLL
ncbi:hypothetical protein PIB30_118707 [Stylosanthes scabra]|uniref:RNase H type-1 domain-containing protein n=1 Tax=Stylosanthes scabra TaxID=79078 RepID=A0ABU6Q9L9_9FABA|nr:hypothetical protein [Stylosanthes scabra]